MSSPTRRPIRLRHVLRGVRSQLDTTIDEIELGWSALLDDLNHAGWPACTPEDDKRERGPRHRQPSDDSDHTGTLDYADPTGQLAARLTTMHDDRETLEDHRHCVETSLRALHLIANRHRPPATPALPACSLTTCREPVESYAAKGGIGFRGMRQIAGVWVTKPGEKALCRRHRAEQERRAS